MKKYYCKDCGKEIHQYTALYGLERCRSCSKKSKRNGMFKFNITKKFLTQEYIKNKKSMSKIAKELKISVDTVSRYLKKYNIPIRIQSETMKLLHLNYYGKNSPCYIDGRCSKIYYCIDCDKEITYQSALYGQGRCRACAQSKSMTGKLIGKKNGAYIHGQGYAPYPLEFNDNLKLQIRQRDNYICQKCNITEEEHLIVYGKVLDVHHIDYAKENCKEENLITLCNECNIRANYNRDYWYAYFMYIREKLHVYKL